MDINKASELWDAAHEIRIERDDSDNSAERVGSLLEAMIEYDEEEAIIITSLEGQMDDVNGSIDRMGNQIGTISNRITEIEQNGTGGGSGGSGLTGYEKGYTLNTPHYETGSPAKPNVKDYNYLSDTFPTSDSNKDWRSDNPNPKSGEDTWIAFVWFKDGKPDSAGEPIRIYNGAIQGTSNGEDSEEREWIYHRRNDDLFLSTQWENTQNAINNFVSSQDSRAESKIGSKGISFWTTEWEDHPSGIDATHKFEYAMWRDSTNENGSRVWGINKFNGPILWARWGDKGLDGDGVEYIFYASANGTPPSASDSLNWPPNWINTATGESYQGPEYIPESSLWEDDPIDLSLSSNYGPGSKEWVSMRKKQYDSTAGKHVWGPYSEPALWSSIPLDVVASGYTVDLDNENMPVGSDGTGNITSWSDVGYVNAWHNGEPLTLVANGQTLQSDEYSFSIGNVEYSRPGANVTGSISGSANGNEVTISITNVTNFENINAFIPITINLPDGSTRYLRFSIYPIYTGIAGSNINLWLSAHAIGVDSNQICKPPSVDVGIKIGNKRYMSGAITESAESMGYHFAYYKNTSTEYNIINQKITLSGSSGVPGIYTSNLRTLKIEVRKGTDYASGEFVDSEEINFTKDGVGIASIVTYYRAVESTSLKPAGNNDITESDKTNVEETGWGESKPYLYRREKTTYTNGLPYWGDTQPAGVWYESDTPEESDKSVYALSVNPPYIILEEQLNPDGHTSIPIPQGTNIIVELRKGFDTQTISLKDDHDNSTLTSVNVYARLNNQSSNSKKIVIDITSVSFDPDSSSAIKQGYVYFEIYSPNADAPIFMQVVKVPIYFNRLGSFERTIKQGYEEAIGEITEFYPTDGSIPAEGTWFYNQINGAKGTFTSLGQRINGIETNASEAKQTAEEISFSVNNGWYNYVKNPLAIDGTLGTYIVEGETLPTYSNYSIRQEDPIVGKCITMSSTLGGEYQLLYGLENGHTSSSLNYTSLQGLTVTWFCIVKRTSNSNTDQIYFGSGDGSNGSKSNTIVRVKYDSVNGKLYNAMVSTSLDSTTFNTSVFKTGAIELGDGWGLYYTTARLNSNKGIIPNNVERASFNNMNGTWWIYYAGIIKGDGVPTFEMIRTGAGLQSAGIDISHGTITSKGENFKWENNDGQQILGLNEKGDAEFAGTVKASNLYHGVCIWGHNKWFRYEKPPYINAYSLVNQNITTYWVGFGPNQNNQGMYAEVECESMAQAEEWASEAKVFCDNNFIVGKYYEYIDSKFTHIKDSVYNALSSPNLAINPYMIDNSIQVFSDECSGNADVIIIPNATNSSISPEIYLPRAQDYEGKIVEIFDSRTSNNNIEEYIVSIVGNGAKKIDTDSNIVEEFGGGMNSDYTVGRLNSSATVSPGTSRFYSYFDGGKWWWLRLSGTMT